MTRALMIGLMFAATFVLSACGADGEPEQPTRADRPTTGLSVTGSVSVGLGGSL